MRLYNSGMTKLCDPVIFFFTLTFLGRWEILIKLCCNWSFILNLKFASYKAQ